MIIDGFVCLPCGAYFQLVRFNISNIAYYHADGNSDNPTGSLIYITGRLDHPFKCKFSVLEVDSELFGRMFNHTKI